MSMIESIQGKMGLISKLSVVGGVASLVIGVVPVILLATTIV